MVKNQIKIYARLKRDHEINLESVFYQVCKYEENDMIIFRLNNKVDIVNNRPQNHQFRFHRIFDQDASQTEMFDSIAKPVVKSVLNGYNGTIFAYGQTGSGKTYAITGSSKNYNGRGIIPRSIEEIFSIIEQSSDSYSIMISYLEIYNEIGYDLLNPKQQVSSLEELPKIMLLEDGKGESHLRNLTMKKVTTKHEAMRLLYLGDTNRTMAETPMNVYSSRSHCIFTISVTYKNVATGKVRRSKLNLVDLAGSERIKKSNISGTTLNEARHINLSLHYLEQVVTALSQKRTHIPFRNSMLTYMLRDSLSGNCLTVLIATLATTRKNIEETLATCKFAQRVADVSMEATANLEIDPQHEIEFLRNEINDLQKQILNQTNFMVPKVLTEEEKDHWKLLINNYVNDPTEDLYLSNYDVRHIQYCFKRFKETVKEQEQQKLIMKVIIDGNNQEIENCKQIIDCKEKEIQTLKNHIIIDPPKPKQRLTPNTIPPSTLNEIDKENIPPTIHQSYPFSPAQREAFKMFMENPQNTVELDFYKQSIEDMYKIATNLNAVVEQCQMNIVNIKSKLELNQTESILGEINMELVNQQTIYRNSLVKLQNLKNESTYFKTKWEQARNDVIQNFIKWYNNIESGDFIKGNHDVDTRIKELLSFKNSVMQDISKMNLNFNNKPSSGLDRRSCPTNSRKDISSLDSSLNRLASFNSGNSNVLQLESERPYSRESKKHHSRNSLISMDSVSSNYSLEKIALLEEIKRKMQIDDVVLNKSNEKIGLKGAKRSSKTICYYSACFPCDTNSSLVIDEPRQLDKIIEAREEEFCLKNYEESLNAMQLRNAQERQFCNPNICNNQCYSLYNNNMIQSENGFRTSLNAKLESVKTKLAHKTQKEPTLESSTTNFFENPQMKSREGDGSDSDSYRTALGQQTSNYQTSILANMAGLSLSNFEDPVDWSQASRNLPYVYNSLFQTNDPPEFKDIVKTVTLTGDFEVDVEIIKFYRAKFNIMNHKYANN